MPNNRIVVCTNQAIERRPTITPPVLLSVSLTGFFGRSELTTGIAYDDQGQEYKFKCTDFSIYPPPWDCSDADSPSLAETRNFHLDPTQAELEIHIKADRGSNVLLYPSKIPHVPNLLPAPYVATVKIYSLVREVQRTSLRFIHSQASLLVCVEEKQAV